MKIIGMVMEAEQSTHSFFSVTKSFVSALVGIAHNEGLIDSIEDPITKYLPDLMIQDMREFLLKIFYKCLQVLNGTKIMLIQTLT